MINNERYYGKLLEACHNVIKEKDCSKYFKRYNPELPRVKKIIGILKGVGANNILDVGSGRGRLLWPMMDALPNSNFTSIESNAWRCEVIRAVANGGVARLGIIEDDMSTTSNSYSYQVVVASEVLEHIQDVQKALNNIINVAVEYIIITVPKHPDNNPDHIHFLTKEKWPEMIMRAENATGKKIKNVVYDFTNKELVIFINLK